MPDDPGLPLRLLEGLAQHPAIAFHEDAVAAFITESLRSIGVSAETDAYGNIIARVPGTARDVPPIAFVAHMDHPGFEAVERDGDRLVARALGGVPPSCFTQPVPVFVLADGDRRIPGRLDGAVGPPEDRKVAVSVSQPDKITLPAAVVFDLPDFSRDGDRLSLRAADDLAGCAAALSALHRLAADPAAGDVYGVFTRAEEVGLIGARLIARERRIPLDCLVVSIESSRELPGAIAGEGPVIRVGDAMFTFSAEAEQVLHVARMRLRDADPGFRAQRQLMSGGTCEASAFAARGYAATGVAFPLGNYHNATPDGGVDSEFIHADDFAMGARLVLEAARSVADRRGSPAWRRLLEETPAEEERLRGQR